MRYEEGGRIYDDEWSCDATNLTLNCPGCGRRGWIFRGGYKSAAYSAVIVWQGRARTEQRRSGHDVQEIQLVLIEDRGCYVWPGLLTLFSEDAGCLACFPESTADLDSWDAA